MLPKYLTRTIIVLSLVSMFNDVSSEMLIPVMPVYLSAIGFSVFWIGLLEGAAEATAGLSKIYFGRLSDKTGRRMPFVQLGYFLSALAKPIIGLFQNAMWIFSARTADRLGKGIRTAARDALLSDETDAKNKGAVFGFHRMFDTIGATIGPVLAMVFLYFYPAHYKELFLLAAIPSFVSVGLTFFIHEKNKSNVSLSSSKTKTKKPSLASQFFYWKNSPVEFRKLVIGLLLFGLVNSSDIFLLLKSKMILHDDYKVLALYIFYNLVYASVSFPLGKLADKIGLKKMFVFGLIIFSVVYSGMSFSTEVWQICLLFILYGIFNAATEGISKALISNLVPKTETATAIGFYAGWNSICALFASVFAGFLWYQLNSPQATFLVTGSVTMMIAIYLSTIKIGEKKI